MNDCRLSVSILVGMAIASIGLELPGFAVPQPAPVLVSQVACKVSSNMIAVYETAKSDEEVVGTLRRGTLVGLVRPLSMSSTPRVEIDQPMIGFVSRAALNCGTAPPTVIKPPTTTACRTVRDSIPLKYVFEKADGQSRMLATVSAKMRVWVTQTGGGITHKDIDGVNWVQVDLQRTFQGEKFGVASGFGWLSNTDPVNQLSTLVNGCN